TLLPLRIGRLNAEASFSWSVRFWRPPPLPPSGFEKAGCHSLEPEPPPPLWPVTFMLVWSWSTPAEFVCLPALRRATLLPLRIGRLNAEASFSCRVLLCADDDDSSCRFSPQRFLASGFDQSPDEPPPFWSVTLMLVWSWSTPAELVCLPALRIETLL